MCYGRDCSGNTFKNFWLSFLHETHIIHKRFREQLDKTYSYPTPLKSIRQTRAGHGPHEAIR
jgi:hypothetical protein